MLCTIARPCVHLISFFTTNLRWSNSINMLICWFIFTWPDRLAMLLMLGISHLPPVFPWQLIVLERLTVWIAAIQNGKIPHLLPTLYWAGIVKIKLKGQIMDNENNHLGSSLLCRSKINSSSTSDFCFLHTHLSPWKHCLYCLQIQGGDWLFSFMFMAPLFLQLNRFPLMPQLLPD